MFQRPTDILRSSFYLKMPLQTCTRPLRPLLENFSEWRREACGPPARELEPRCAPNQLICQLTLCIAITNWPVYISRPTHLLILCCCCSHCCSTSCCFLCIHSPPPSQCLPAGSVYLWFLRGLLLISPCSCFGWSKKLCSQGGAETESDSRIKLAFGFILNKTDYQQMNSSTRLRCFQSLLHFQVPLCSKKGFCLLLLHLGCLTLTVQNDVELDIRRLWILCILCYFMALQLVFKPVVVQYETYSNVKPLMHKLNGLMSEVGDILCPPYWW